MLAVSSLLSNITGLPSVVFFNPKAGEVVWPDLWKMHADCSWHLRKGGLGVKIRKAKVINRQMPRYQWLVPSLLVLFQHQLLFQTWRRSLAVVVRLKIVTVVMVSNEFTELGFINLLNRLLFYKRCICQIMRKAFNSQINGDCAAVAYICVCVYNEHHWIKFKTCDTFWLVTHFCAMYY